MPRGSPTPPVGKGGACKVCNHPAVFLINTLLAKGAVEFDGKPYTAVQPLVRALNEKFPDLEPLNDANVSRHKQNGHVTTRTMRMVAREGKLYQVTPAGKEVEVVLQSVERMLEIIMAIGLQAVMEGRLKLTEKGLMDAIKQYSDLKKGKEDNDDYETLIAEKLANRTATVIIQDGQALPSRVSEQSVDDMLASLPQVAPPDDFFEHVRREKDDDDDDEEDD